MDTTMVKVKFLKDATGTDKDGKVYSYKKGQTMSVSKELASKFETDGSAEISE